MALTVTGKVSATDVRALAGKILRATDYKRVYAADPLVRMELVSAGIPARDGKQIMNDLAVTASELHVGRSTIDKKVRNDELLPIDVSERLLGFAKLAGQVQTMVEESGDPTDFDAVAWTHDWLQTPLPALGGRKPMALMSTIEGQGIVSDMLARIQSGAFA